MLLSNYISTTAIAIIFGIFHAIYYFFHSLILALWNYLLKPLFGKIRTNNTLIKDTFVNRIKVFPTRLLNVVRNLHKIIAAILIAPIVGLVIGGFNGFLAYGSYYSVNELPLNKTTSTTTPMSHFFLRLLTDQIGVIIEELVNLAPYNPIFQNDNLQPPVQPQTSVSTAHVLEKLEKSFLKIHSEKELPEIKEAISILKQQAKRDPQINTAIKALNQAFGIKKSSYAFWKSDIDVFMDEMFNEASSLTKDQLVSAMSLRV